MKLVGQIVEHETLGDGIIVDENDLNGNKYFTVNFITEIKEFAFPGIFETNKMRLKNNELQSEINELYLNHDNDVKELKNNLKLTNNIEEDLKKEYSSIKPLYVKPTHYSTILNKLNVDLFSYYGSNSLDIYSMCCKIFKWESSYSENFGKQGTPLFAKNATPEGYDVWFLAHSNYTEDLANLTWINKISDNQDTVFELWNDSGKHFDEDNIRVIFVKTSNDKYAFLGVYEVTNKFQLENGARLRVFKRISKSYPLMVV